MRVRKILAVALLVTMGLLTSQAPASAKAAAGPVYILNGSSINLGVIHNWDGNYTHGNYDVLLAPGHSTLDFWEKAEGYYVGPGWCVEERYLNSSEGWVWWRTTTRPGTYSVDTARNWKLDAWRGCTG